MPNRLAQSQSLYLRKHAENPIDWWPWCDEALTTAKQERKLIFLSIGYSSCHWCTVMEGEAFSDPAIAAYLNSAFLPIKVDREERPDVDSLYMQALQLMTGQGGWPLNIFLTPDDLVPFYGGTYFSIPPRYGRPGFLQILQALRGMYDNEPQKLANIQTELLIELQQSAQIQPPLTLVASTLWAGIEANTGIVASTRAGTCFPMIPYADLALRGTRFTHLTRFDGQRAVQERGLNLALGGIYDHVAGGFHRYTVDPDWTVPHFEKMLYDNGQIMEYLANLWSAGYPEPAFKRAISGTVAWLKREMTADLGYFYAAQDADSFATATAAEPEEGLFYIWSDAEFKVQLSSTEFDLLQKNFEISPDGNFEGHTVLKRLQPDVLPAPAETALAQLFAVRYGQRPEALPHFPPAFDNQTAKTYPWPGRIPPVTDPKLIVAWNGLMISGLARASVVFASSHSEPHDYYALASQVATWILEHQRIPTAGTETPRLHRLNYQGQVQLLAQSEDFALLIKALLDLHQASLLQDPTRCQFWLTQAQALQAEFDAGFWDDATGGYANTAHDQGQDLLIRERSYIDNATPAANGVAIANLVRLFLLSEDLTYLDRAEAGLRTFSSVIQNSPRACPSLIAALDWFQHPTLVKTTPTALAAFLPRYWPTVMFQLTPDLPTHAVGLVCQGLACGKPAETQAELQAQLEAASCRTASSSMQNDPGT